MWPFKTREHDLTIHRGGQGKWWWSAIDVETGHKYTSTTPGFKTKEEAFTNANILLNSTKWQLRNLVVEDKK